MEQQLDYVKDEIFWYEWKINPTSHAYNICLNYKLYGNLNSNRLLSVLKQLVVTHSIFNVKFDNEICDKIYLTNEINKNIEIINLPQSNHDHQIIQQILTKVKTTTFQLNKGPLYKFTLVKIDNNTYYLFMCFHHIIVDGLSELYIHDFITKNYNQTGLVTNSINISDYLNAKQSIANHIKLKSQNFWQQETQKILADANYLDAITLNQNNQYKYGKYIYFKIDKNQTNLLAKLKINNQTSWFCLIMSIYAITLSKLLNHNKLNICYAVNCRPADAKNMLGCFVNSLPMPINLQDNSTMLSALQLITQTRQAQKEHQNYPFLKIIDLLKKDNSKQIKSLLNIALIETHIQTKALNLNDITTETLIHTDNESIYDLCLEYEFINEEIEFRFNYRENYINPTIANNFYSYFMNTAQAMLINNNQLINSFSILSNQERLQLVNGFNDTYRNYPLNKTILDYLTDHARSQPTTKALIFEDQVLTYGDLEQKVTSLAKYLANNNNQEIIPIILNTNIELPVAMLAILKSGAAYVPIDPKAPKQRILAIIEGCHPQQIITSQQYKTKISQIINEIDISLCNIICIEDQLKDSASQLPKIASNNPAYIIYTSGSTGRPKGVRVPHKALINFLLSMQEILNYKAKDKFINITPITFDIAGLEIYLPLITGSCCILMPQEDAANGDIIAQTIKDHDISFVQTTPTKWQLLLETGWQKNPANILCGGEILPSKLAAQLLAIAPKVWNVYGPTETTIWSTTHQLTQACVNQDNITIGKPIANTKAYILNDNLQLMPIGCVGKLYISGQGLAIDYLNNTDLTQASFIKTPPQLHISSNTADDRIYYTGDLGRWLANGNLECLGRNDHQIKYNGNRIELTEIEFALGKHPKISQAVVVLKTILPSNQKHLTAYYLSNNNIELTSNEIRDFLATILPQHSIPSYFIKSATLPLTTSGKVDRKQLTNTPLNINLENTTSNNSNQLSSPIVKIWAKTLAIPQAQINNNSNLFDLGGDSLTALKITYLINKEFQIKSKVQDILNNPTPDKLYSWIQKHALLSSEIDLKITKVKLTELIPISTVQTNFYNLNKLTTSGSYNILLAWQISGNLDIKLLSQAINCIRKHNNIFNTTYYEDNKGIYQNIIQYFDLEINAETIDEKSITNIISKENQYNFQLQQEAPFRVRILTPAPEKYILLINMFHIIFDETSIHLFIKTLTDNYNKLLTKAVISVNANRLQYTDYIYWEQALHQSAMMKNSEIFWQQYLAKAKLTNLNINKQQPKKQQQQVNITKILIKKTSLQQFQIHNKEQNTTWFMSILSMMYILISKYTNRQDITTAIPVSLRDSIELNDMFGVFINTLLLREQINPEDTYPILLNRIKKNFYNILKHKHINFDNIYAKLDQQRCNNNLPILINWSNQKTIQDLDLQDVTVERIPIYNTGAKADISFNFIESSDTIELTIESNAALHNLVYIKSITHSINNILNDINNNINQSISTLNLLSRNLYNQIVYTWNNTNKEFPINSNITDLFKIKAQETPNKTAIESNNKTITYQELEIQVIKLSKQISSYISQHSVPEKNSEYQVIAIYLTRDIHTIITILAILEAGYAYLPLARDLPKDRLKHMLTKVNCKLIVITHQDELDNINDINKITYNQLTSFKASNNSISKPNNYKKYAYIIYTSGSTGLPKATLITHQSAINCIYSILSKLNLNQQEEVFLSITDYSFDVSVIEFLLPVLSSNKLVILDDMARKDPRVIIKHLTNITAMQATPSMWMQLIQQKWQGNKNFKILSAGEALDAELTSSLLKCGTVYNIYGPTEATIYSTITKITTTKDISIGKPIDNAKCYILDKNKNPVPIGVHGELYIGGIGVAAGYLNNEELSKKSFIDNPFIPNQKMYKTGDLVSWDTNSNILYHGRLDQQIKLRGYRIELQEIESQILKHLDIINVKIIFKSEQENSYLAAFIITKNNVDITQKLKLDLAKKLPSYMLPRYYIICDEFPLTVSGKINYRQLESKLVTTNNKSKFSNINHTNTKQTLKTIFESILNTNINSLEQNIFDLGINSLSLITVQSQIENNFELSRPIELVDLFNYTTIIQLANYIDGLIDTNIKTDTKKPKTGSNAIAIIGISGEFPGAENITEFWNNILDGKESISHFTAEELINAGVSKKLINNKNYIKSRGILKNTKHFDAEFFNISPKEAELTDPQHRLMLEHSYAALENAGYATQKYIGRIGVFTGADDSNYISQVLNKDSCFLNSNESFQTMLATGNNFLSTKISYKINLTGPSLNINTACSTGLVVIANACQQLVNNDCDIALAGAVSIKQPYLAGYTHQAEGITSADGHCRAFSNQADGTVPSAGVGVLVLKPLDKAIEDKDNIHAIIKGWNVNNDGADKIGYTAPSIKQQANCMATAIKKANIQPSSLQYLEMHGTGTKLGDPIEIRATSLGFIDNTVQTCAIGSVKSNIGHADAAAGIASIIKTVQALKHKTLPKTLHYNTSNKNINFNKTPFYVNTSNKPWKRISKDMPRIAGVNALGLGGTNAFVVLQEAPQPEQQINDLSSNYLIFPFSAKSEIALNKMLNNFYQFIQSIDKNKLENEIKLLADIAHTLQLGRNDYKYKQHFVSNTLSDLTIQITNHINIFQDTINYTVAKTHQIVFFFPGQGCQYQNMGQHLYTHEPVFKHAVDTYLTKLFEYTAIDLKPLLFTTNPATQINSANHAQNMLFCIEYSLVELLKSWGIEPDLLIGHSFGEYVAAYTAGVFSLDDAIKIIAYRTKLIQATSVGSMLSIPLSVTELEPYLGKDIAIATKLAPKLTVVSGDTTAIDRLIKQLITNAVINQKQLTRLTTTRAFHSDHMNTAATKLKQFFTGISLSPPKKPIISNLTGTVIEPKAMLNPDYWAQHLVKTVQIESSIETILEKLDNPLFISVGPGQDLQSILKYNTQKPLLCINSLVTIKQAKANPNYADKIIYQALGKIWENTTNIVTWQNLPNNKNANKIQLPTYPFTRDIYWPQHTKDNIKSKHTSLASATSLDQNTANSLYTTNWQQTETIQSIINNYNTKDNYIIFIDSKAGAKQLISQLKSPITIIITGNSYNQHSSNEFTISYENINDYFKLFDQLNINSQATYKIINIWDTNSANNKFKQVFNLVKTLTNYNKNNKFYITNILNNLFSIFGETIDPKNSTLLAFTAVTKFENPNIIVNCLDISNKEYNNYQELLAITNFEINQIEQNNQQETYLAYKQGYRWIQVFRPANLTNNNIKFNSKKVYIILGGLSGIGLAIATELMLNHQVKVALISRRKLPKRSNWNNWLKAKNTDHEYYQLITELTTIEQQGGEFVVANADITDYNAMQSAMINITTNFGKIAGVIHSAGVAGSGLIAIKNYESITQTLSSKIIGTEVLAKLFSHEPLDFMVFFSSLSSITGGIGQLDYCAANLYLNNLSKANMFNSKTKILTINWNKWLNTGMATMANDAGFTKQYLDTININSINANEGVELFYQILDSHQSQIIVSTQVINKYQMQMLQASSTNTTKKIRKSNDSYLDPKVKLVTLIKDLLGIKNLNLHNNFFEIGGHSLLALQLIDRIKQEFNVEIIINDIYQTNNIIDLINLVIKPKNNINDLEKYIIPMQKTKRGLPLFLVHPVGGAVFCYLNLVKKLNYNGPIYAIQDPALNQQNHIFHSLQDMAELYLSQIKLIQPHGPYYLGGFSLGGNIAFEIANKLMKQGASVKYLGLIDSWAKLPGYDKQQFAHSMEQQLLSFKFNFEKIGCFNIKELLPHQLSRMDLFQKNHHGIIKLPIYLYKARELLPQYTKINNCHNLWQQHTTCNIITHEVAGNHETMLEASNVLKLAEFMNQDLKSIIQRGEYATNI